MSAVAPHPNETNSLFAELDYRENDAVQVWLLWNRKTNNLSVYVWDARASESFEIAACSSRAREVFLHPYAYRDSRPQSD